MEDNVIGVSIEVDGIQRYVKTVGEAEKAQKDLQKTIDKSDFGSDEYKKATAELDKLNNEMGQTTKEAAKIDNSITGLKKQFKELKAALANAADPKEFARLSAELNEVEGKLGDMNDAANAASGSGVEQLNKGFGLIREGFSNFDFDKIKIGFKAVGNAMSAAVPFLLVEVVTQLIQNFDKVKAVFFQVFPALDSVSESTKNLEREQKKLIETNKTASANLENEIRIMEASGKSEKDIIKAKKELIALKIKELEGDTVIQKSRLTDIAQNDSLVESVNRLQVAYLRKTGQDKQADLLDQSITANKIERAKEFTDKIKENELALSTLKADLQIVDIEAENKAAANYKKSIEDREKIGEENYQKYKAIADAKKQAEIDAANEEATIVPEIKQAQAISEIEIQANKNAALLSESAKAKEEELRLEKELNAKKLAERQVLEKVSYDSAKNLSDALFAVQLAAAEKGSAREKQLKKQAFQTDKAFSLVKATNDGYKAVLSTYADTPGGIFIKGLAAAGAAAFAIKQIANIAGSKFDGGSSSAPSSVSTSAPSANVQLPEPPVFTQPNSNTSTSFDSNGNNTGSSSQRQAGPMVINVKAEVYEGEMTRTQRNVQRLEEQASW